MGILDFIKGEFLEVIAWEDQNQDTMVWKFPIPEKQQIKNGAQLIVRPSQVAVFVYQGQIADVYEPGTHTLNSDNMPVLTTLKNWKYALNSPFKTDVYFVNTKQFLNQKWGTPNPVMMRDADFGTVRLRAFGVYSFRVVDPVTFLKEVFGTSTLFTLSGVNEHLKSIVVSALSDALGQSGIPAIDLAAKYIELSKLVQDNLQERFGQLGFGVADFVIENISLPEAVEQAIDKRSQMGALGNLDQYMKYQTAEAIRDAAQNEGGLSGMGAGMGAGVGIGQAMAASMGGMMQQPSAPQQNVYQPAPQQQPPAQAMISCPNCNHQVPATSKFCPECGKSTKKSCPNCKHPIEGNPKFCSECGHNL